MRKSRVLFACFGLSFLLHLAALACLQRYSLWFSSAQTAESSESWLSLVDKQEKEKILKSSFDSLSKETQKEPSLSPSYEEELLAHLENPLKQDPFDLKGTVVFQLSFPMENLLASSVFPSFSVRSSPVNLLEHLPKDLLIPLPQKASPKPFLPLPTKTSLTLSFKPTVQEANKSSPILYTDELGISLRDELQHPKAPPPIPLPNLPKLPSLEELQTTSHSDSFDADLVFFPKEDEEGYVFALTLIPKPDLSLPKLKQHITFMLDRSNSIQQERLNATKTAIHRALKELDKEDTFNIIAFDSKVEKMSPRFLPCKGQSFALAEEFLDKIHLGSFFSTSDVYKPLLLTVPGDVKQDEVYTAILFTDAESLGKKSAQKAISNWTFYNSGKVCLFSLGMYDAHQWTLDATSQLNRGKLINVPTYRGMKRKLLKLLKSIQSPIAKNISCHAISRTPSGKISLFPNPSQMPHLYLDQPYVILGETKTLDDFILFLQGRLKDRWLNIRKTVSFVNARKGNKSLKAEVALQKAYALYEKFSLDENPEHLVEAKKLLQPYDFEIAF